MGQFSMEISGHAGSVLSGNQQPIDFLRCYVFTRDDPVPTPNERLTSTDFPVKDKDDNTLCDKCRF